MTENPSTQSPSTQSPDTPAADDPRAVFARSARIAGTVVAAVRPDQMELPTPCGEFDVRLLLAHLVGVLDRVATLGAGGDVFTVPDHAEVVPDAEWPARWAAAAEAVEAAWRDDASLGRDYQLPWTTLPGPATLAIYTNEIVVHTWDLARATGQQPAWDPTVLEVALGAIHAELPEPGRAAMWVQAAADMGVEPFPAPFGDAVEVPDDAPAIDRLVAWNGRRP